MPADMSKYPANWPEIRARILRRAGGNEDDPRVGARCEKCGIRNYAIRAREEWEALKGFDSYQDAKGFADDHNRNAVMLVVYGRASVVVLTIAHIHDPNPQNVADDNLQALCQKCHNGHDVEYRKRNRANTRRAQIVQNGQQVLI